MNFQALTTITVVDLDASATTSQNLPLTFQWSVVFGAADPKAGACHTLYQITNDPRLNHRTQVIAGVLADRCGAVLSDFFAAKRRLGKG